MPNPILIGRTYYLRVRVPNDVAEFARGTMIAVLVGDKFVTVKVGDVVKVSLKSPDADEAKQRFTQVLAAVDAHWGGALRCGPARL
ncbi:DUF6538 domain-containing protein [uncultured Shimia sp.]|uniref:DUF6538 domain-containing protein n=1 Tax=uncultured Shimia sp. TaxID=573152 RepID=UPI002604CBA7|nr:DUF6538 domain-containing protein [uncultured Shimia sp.]